MPCHIPKKAGKVLIMHLMTATNITQTTYISDDNSHTASHHLAFKTHSDEKVACSVNSTVCQ